jgi:glucokinase
VGGGIAQHMMPWLQQASFTEAFSFKGRFSDLVAAIPVHVITDPDVALKGAALFAARGLK